MTIDFAVLMEKILWSGVAALGFGILFNIPHRIRIEVFALGALGGVIKFSCLQNHVSIVVASLFAASTIGFTTVFISNAKHTSPFVLSIPAIIPMIPGYFAYKMLIALVGLAINKDLNNNDVEILFSVMHNGLNMLFILLGLTIGVSLPSLILKKRYLSRLTLNKEEDFI